MSTPTDFIWSFGGGLRKVEEKQWFHDWMGQIKVRTSEDDSWSTKSFGDEPDDSDATSQCSEIIYQSGEEPEEESRIIEVSQMSTVMESHQELPSECEPVLMHKDNSWPGKVSFGSECSQISTVAEFWSEKELFVSECSQISTVVELHQELSSQCEAVLMHKESLPEEELSSRISTVMELHQELSSQCEVALARKDNLNNQTQPVEHLSIALADALRELQATKATNESLKLNYQELLKEHRSLQDKHAMLRVTHDALKNVNCCYDSLRALAMEVYDSLNSKHQNLVNEHRDLSKEHAALKRRTCQDGLLGLQMVGPQTEENLLGVLAQQIY